MNEPEIAKDMQLASLLDQLTEEANRGCASRVEQLTSDYPDLADELRELWGAAMVADVVARYGDTHRLADENDAPRAAKSGESRLPRELTDYELIEEIGRGGMGVVYRARQKSLDRQVAVKLILDGALASDEDQHRFQSEAAAAAQLDHPNIVPIHEIGNDGEHRFFSMQLIDGQTLAHTVAEGPISSRDAARILLEVTRAIAFAHRRGVVHRDLKPANVLIDRDGQPHVTDFGLAMRLTAEPGPTHTGAVLGTPAFMSPEQAAGNRGATGPASDVYSLGAMLYAMLTGRPPFQGTTPVDTILMVLEQEPLPPRLLNRGVDPDLEMIALRCLQKPAELRYASADALADDLTAYLNGEPVSARSGRFSHVLARVFRDTHHAAVLENWGLLWMWHSLVLFVICVVTDWLYAQRVHWPYCNTAGPYLLLWGGALAVWAPTFWTLRHRAGPVTAVERQIAHVWGASIASVISLFVVEHWLGLPVLTLSPVLGLIGGTAFVVKAGILAGVFYVQAAALFATALVMAWMQRRGIEFRLTVFGIVSAAAFFIPGWKYFRQSRGANRY